MNGFLDQTGKVVFLSGPPSRIVSVVPSQTELLFDLGLDEKVIGITKFCIHPTEWYKKKTRIGGTKSLNTDLIVQLKPDLVLANKEENVKEQIEELEKYFPVWTSDVSSVSAAYNMILSVGEITGTTECALSITEKIKSGFCRLPVQNPIDHFPVKAQNLRTAYAIWNDPLMVAGGDTFIHDMMRLCGFQNIFESKNRYPVIELKELKRMDCELLLLSSEPFPFKQRHATDFQFSLPGIEIRLVDGEMFSWYGSRMQYAAIYFEELITDLVKTNRRPGTN
jgi:ABC-type Fe3+-hydroxamate transport system substrate-binding protein